MSDKSNRNNARLPRFAIGCAMASFLFLAGCSTELYTNLTERDANEMIQVLLQQGIQAERTSHADGRYTVHVPSADLPAALSSLGKRGLPRKDFSSLGDAFSADKLVSTPFEERARFMHALNEELSNSLTEIDGVISARVHINLPENSSADNTDKVPRASVFIYQVANLDLAPVIPTIKNLIVNAVPNLRYDTVTVALFTASSQTGAKPEKSFVASRIGSWMGLLPMFGLFCAGIFGLRWSMTRGRLTTTPAKRNT